MSTVDVRSSTPPAITRALQPWTALADLWGHRGLAWQRARREIAARYRASQLGLLWAVLTPLVQLAIYATVFTVVFKQRWKSESPNETHGEFALAMFCGMLVFNLFAECVTRAPGLVTSNPNYVKKLVFPLEVLPLAALLTAVVTFGIGMAVWLVGWLVVMRAPPSAGLLLLPLLLPPVLLMTLGVSWLLASLGVFLRDIGHVVGLAVQLLFFMTPVFYPAENVPSPYRWAITLNPLAESIQSIRGAMMWGNLPDWLWLAAAWAAGLLLAQIGYAFFVKSKRAFADVL